MSRSARPFGSISRVTRRGLIEMLARGLSVRDIEDAFQDETGRLLLSKTAVSQLVKVEDCWIFSPGLHPLRVAF